MNIPKTIVVELTYRCNLRCSMCWWWGEHGIVKAREDLASELPLSAWRQVINSLAAYFPLPHLRITGGEPFIRPDVFELINYIHTHGMSCSFITNGTLLDKYAIRYLVKAGVSQMNFSIDGNRDGDAAVRGPGAYEKTWEAIETVLASRTHQHSARPDVLINCVITLPGLDKVEALIAECRRIQVSLRLQHQMWIDLETYAAHSAELRERFGLEDVTWQGFLNSAGFLDVNRLIEILSVYECLGESAPRTLYTLPRLTASEIRTWYQDTQERILSPLRTSACTYIRNAARIKANGEVIGCPYINYSFGNICDEDFLQLLSSPRAVAFQASLSSQTLPGCARCCK